MSHYSSYFIELKEAIKSLDIFPKLFKEFETFWKQGFRKPHKVGNDGIPSLIRECIDSCKGYSEFIKTVVAEQFLANCLNAKLDEIDPMLKELKTNIDFAQKRLNGFFGENGELDELVEKLKDDFSRLKSLEEKSIETSQKLNKFLDGVKKIPGAKNIGPAVDDFKLHASKAVESDYDHKALVTAFEMIDKSIPEAEESLEENRRALTGIEKVIEVIEKRLEEKESDLSRDLWDLSLLHHDINNACDDIIKKIANL